MPLQNYSEESRQLISDFDARMRDLVQETVEKLMLAENISKVEAEEAIEFNREATQVVFRKRKSPYNAFTEKLAATKKMDTTADVQSEGILNSPLNRFSKKNASTLNKTLNPAEKAALVTDYQHVSKLTYEKKRQHHMEAVSEMKKIIHSYNALCGSDFLVISVFLFNKKSGNVRLIMHMLTAGDTHPSATFAKAFPFQKFKDQTADLKMFGWHEDVAVRRAHEQISGQMHLVLEAIKENTISFAVPGAEAVDTTPATLEVSSPDLAH
ncbi:uncharacterized protein EV154DRAFT_530729 [Mucor mucedo]|uniref:uncharacterized protein n=1 Tax=Mucor mucedo TaxID=29922 RepID=UPI00221FD85A|nr:uncharacterized protein EV154DRAFT_530729 [Mucor mucedo]KAI7869424.1 hypothetical protein EV154DRAFT_530729 [Mucor mucedo]